MEEEEEGEVKDPAWDWKEIWVTSLSSVAFRRTSVDKRGQKTKDRKVFFYFISCQHRRERATQRSLSVSASSEQSMPLHQYPPKPSSQTPSQHGPFSDSIDDTVR